MRIALMGDIHAYAPWVGPWRLIGKRLLAHLNAALNPNRRFDLGLLDRAIQRAMGLGCERLLLTGDLTTSGLPREFRLAGERLDAWLDRGLAVDAVPGNHDAYTLGSVGRIGKLLPRIAPMSFPSLRKLNERWRLLLLDAARPYPMARGRLGHRQLRRAAELVQALPAESRVVVTCHYPFAVPSGIHEGWGHRLADPGALRGLLKRLPSGGLYVHGHVHRPWCWAVELDSDHARPWWVVNAGSPTQVTPDWAAGQGFWVIELPDSPDAPPSLTHHRLTQTDGWRETPVPQEAADSLMPQP